MKDVSPVIVPSASADPRVRYPHSTSSTYCQGRTKPGLRNMAGCPVEKQSSRWGMSRVLLKSPPPMVLLARAVAMGSSGKEKR